MKCSFCGRDKKEVNTIMNHTDLDLLGWMPEDEMIRKYDFSAKPYLDFPDTSPVSTVIDDLLKNIGT